MHFPAGRGVVWIAGCAGVIGSLGATSVAADTLRAQFAVGLGYRICAHQQTPPPLDVAFYCPERVPVLEAVSVELHPEKTNDPAWKLYSGTMETHVRFNQIDVKVELLIAESISPKGETIAYIDGRIGNNQVAGKNYFRLAAEDGFDRLSYSTFYGYPVEFKDEDSVLEFAPELAIARKH